MRSSLHFINTLCLVISVSGVTGSSVVDNLHYVGCYDPGYSLRQKFHHHIPSVTLAKCVQFCQVLKTRFAAVEASANLCYCGGDIGEESIKRNNTLCNIPCPDEPLQTCGGDLLMSLYDVQGASAVDVIDNADFLLGLSTGVRLYHTNNTSTYDTLMTTSDWVYSVDYHFSKNCIFAYSKNKLFKTTLDPKRGTVSTPMIGQVIKNVTHCDGFAVDWVHDRVYWANCDGNGTTIKACGLDGEAEQTVLTREKPTGTALKRMEIDPYKGIVFWTADGVIQSVETSGEEFNPNVTRSEMVVRALALDLEKRRVYYVGTMNQSTSLYSMDYNGGDEVEHFTVPQFRSVYGLSILGDKVFWVTYAKVRDVIYEAPLNLTGVGDVKMLRTIDRAVWHMRVVHPNLQRRPKVDPCLDKGCAHSCVASGATSAKCKCPPGQALHYDGVSCDVPVPVNQDHRAAAGMFFLSILLVLAVVLTSLALVYVGYKYWSLPESKLFGVPYSRSRGREGEAEGGAGTTEYHTGEDNVNLI